MTAALWNLIPYSFLLPHFYRCGGTLNDCTIFPQPLRVAYIGVGTLIGPYGLAYISDANLLTDIAEFGIIFLLFLLGLDMQPKKLLIYLTQDLLGNASKLYRLRPSELFYWTFIWV